MRSSLASSVGFLLTALAGMSCGGSSSSPSFESFFPASNAVGTWVEDTTAGKAGVEVYSTKAQVEAVIDGDVVPFADHNFATFGREYYTDGAQKLQLRIWGMPNAATAKTLYDDLIASSPDNPSVSRYPVYGACTWENVSVGEMGRTANTGTRWWVNAAKHGNYFEVLLTPTTDGDAAGRTAAETFAAAVAAKLP